MDTYVEACSSDPHHRTPPWTSTCAGCAACDEEARSLIDLLRVR